MSISEIKKDAKNYLKDNYGRVLGLCALYTAIMGIFSFINGFVSGLIPVVGGIVSYIVVVLLLLPIYYGFTKTLVMMKKGENVNILKFFIEGFNDFKRAISTWWSCFWRRFLKTIPGKIITLIGVTLFTSYMAYWIITIGLQTSTVQKVMNGIMPADDYESFMQTLYSLSLGLSDYANTFIIVKNIGIVLMVIGIFAVIPFILEYVIYDIVAVSRTDLNSAQVAKESKNLMIGNRFKYIGLLLSFVGWYILCILSCGFGIIFLMPYIQIARISFYESLVENKGVVVDNNQQPIQ